MARRKLIIVIVVALIYLVTACSSQPPIPESTNTHVAEVVQPTETPPPQPTNTPEPINTLLPEPTDIPTPTETLTIEPTATVDPQALREVAEKGRKEFIELTTNFLENGEGLEEIEKINLLRFNDAGVLEIEILAVYSSQDNQPFISYKIIAWLATAWTPLPEDYFNLISGGESFAVQITSYSSDGDYPYQSVTNYETLQLLENKEISYEEWVSASNGGFK